MNPTFVVTLGLSRSRTGLREPVQRNINRQRLRKYLRDRRPESVVVELLTGPLRRRGDALAPAMAVMGAGG